MIYLDNASTTKTYDLVAKDMLDVLINNFGNPSSLHKVGRDAKKIVDEGKKILAKTINCLDNEIYFTSGGTESINTAIMSVCKKYQKRGKHIIAFANEHSASINILKELIDRGFEVDFIKPNKNGNIDIDEFKKYIRNDTILASFMLVNNEIGSKLPIKEMNSIFKSISKFGVFHVDAVQALCKIDINIKDLDIDLMSFSGHKIGACKGIGALYIKKNLNLPPYIYGGGQQDGMRSGTENTVGIKAFTKAIEINKLEYNKDYIKELANYLDMQLKENFNYVNFCYNGVSDIDYIQNFSIPNIQSEVALRILESYDIYVSAGSACSKGKISYVLLNMDIPKDIANSALRISFNMDNTKDDIDKLINALKICVETFKK